MTATGNTGAACGQLALDNFNGGAFGPGDEYLFSAVMKPAASTDPSDQS